MAHVHRGALAATVTLLAACGGEPQRPAADPADTVAFAMRTVADSVGTCRTSATDSTKVPCIRVDIRWPELTGDSARVGQAKAFIHRVVASSFQNGTDLGSPDSVKGEMLAVHRLMGEQHKGGYNTPWHLERNVSVACNDPHSFGIKVVSRQRTVEPHLMSATRYANFDARTGAPIGIEDYLKDGKEQEFRRAAAKAYQARKESEKALGAAKVNPDSFPMPRTVLACGDSLVLQYDAIVMGPHRVLDASVTLHREALKGLVKF